MLLERKTLSQQPCGRAKQEETHFKWIRLCSRTSLARAATTLSCHRFNKQDRGVVGMHTKFACRRPYIYFSSYLNRDILCN